MTILSNFTEEIFGKVIWFNENKGYGEVVSDIGTHYFFTYHVIQKDSPRKNLKSGDNVKFSVSDNFLFGKLAISSIQLSTKQLELPLKTNDDLSS